MFIKVPMKIFDYRLSGNEMKVYLIWPGYKLIPMLIIYFFAQKSFIEGMTAGSVETVNDMRRTKLKDIAQYTQMSMTAVSLVLNNKPCKLSEGRNKRFCGLRKELNYSQTGWRWAWPPAAPIPSG